MMKHKIQFNDGFVTAIALFLEHKNWIELLRKDKEGRIICDLRLYGATDHLYDMNIPTNLTEKFKKRILKWRAKCFHYRLELLENTKLIDDLFKEAEDILAKIDKYIFTFKKVTMRYR